MREKGNGLHGENSYQTTSSAIFDFLKQKLHTIHDPKRQAHQSRHNGVGQCNIVKPSNVYTESRVQKGYTLNIFFGKKLSCSMI